MFQKEKKYLQTLEKWLVSGTITIDAIKRTLVHMPGFHPTVVLTQM